MPPMISRSTISTNLQRQTPAGSRRGECFRLTWQLGLFALIQRFRAIRILKRGSSSSLIPVFGLWGVSASCSELLARGTGNRLASCNLQSKGALGYNVLPGILRLRTWRVLRQQRKKLPNGSLLKTASESISRVLSLDDHLSRTCVAARLKHATRTYGGPPCRVPICACSGWGFPSHAVADALVRSYRTVSAFLPLPRAEARVRGGVFFSVALIRRVAPPSR